MNAWRYKRSGLSHCGVLLDAILHTELVEMSHFPYGHVKDNLGAVDRHLLSALFGTNKSAVKQ